MSNELINALFFHLCLAVIIFVCCPFGFIKLFSMTYMHMSFTISNYIHVLPIIFLSPLIYRDCITFISSSKKDDYIKNLHVLSCFILSKSVLLISCVFWIFFTEHWQSTLFQIFFLYV